MHAFYVNVRPTGDNHRQGFYCGPYFHHGDAAVAADSVRRYFGSGPGRGRLGPWASFGVARVTGSSFPTVRAGKRVSS